MKNKNPWEMHPNIWKTKAAFMNFVRGGVRRGLWEKHPVKLEFLKRNRTRIKNPNPKGKRKEVWGGVCSVCEKEFSQSKLQVDHVEGNHSLKTMDDLRGFVEAMIFVDYEDLRMICKECHYIKSYADRSGLTFEQAKAKKEAIRKSKQPVSKQKKELLSLGFKEEEISNQKKRRECYESYFGI